MSTIVDASSQGSQDKGQTQESSPQRSKLVQRLLDASASLPAFMKDLLTTQAVLVAGTEAAAFLVERSGENSNLRLLHHIRPDESDNETRANAVRAFQNLVGPCVQAGKDGAIEVGTADGGDAQFCLVTVLRADGIVVAVTAVVTRCRDVERARQRLTSMQLVAGYFDLFSLRRYVENAKALAERHQHVLQYSGAVATGEGFDASAMSLCNELANRTGASRVALGWLKGRNIKVKALSHTEKFDKKQELIVSIEKVMEECLDQEEPVRFDPAGNSSQNVTRSARGHSMTQGNSIVMSLPLRKREDIIGVLTMEFPSGQPFDAQMEAGISAGAELLAPQLADRYDNDRYIWVKMGHTIRNIARMAIGPKHMAGKLLIVFGIALILFVSLFKPTYHVKGAVVFHPKDKRFLSAPWEGIIDKVFFKPGQHVAAGQPIATMRTFDLEVRASMLKHQSNAKIQEAEKARKEGKQSDVQIALAESDAAKAELKLIEYQISEAEIKAPFNAVVLKGDLFEKQGVKVQQGDVLFEIALADDKDPTLIAIEAELNVSERDIEEIRRVFADRHGKANAMDGLLATTAFPEDEFKFKLRRVVPDGKPKEGENVFAAYADVYTDKPDRRLQPGVAGEARVEIGQRRLVWIWTHRLTDWLKLKMWRLGETGF